MSSPTNNHVRQYREGLRLEAGETRHGSNPQWGAPITTTSGEFYGSREWLDAMNRLYWVTYGGGVTTPKPAQ